MSEQPLEPKPETLRWWRGRVGGPWAAGNDPEMALLAVQIMAGPHTGTWGLLRTSTQRRFEHYSPSG